MIGGIFELTGVLEKQNDEKAKRGMWRLRERNHSPIRIRDV